MSENRYYGGQLVVTSSYVEAFAAEQVAAVMTAHQHPQPFPFRQAVAVFAARFAFAFPVSA